MSVTEGFSEPVRRLFRHAIAVGNDAQLVRRFVQERDETAFEVLVRRHGPMVLGVCRRVLDNRPDADDAFQATFMVFLRRAASLKRADLVANWLYGVAYRTALEAKTKSVRRKMREKQLRDVPDRRMESESSWEELRLQLDRELSRLPDKYRVPIVLCDLEGRTRKDVAAQLQIPEGTLSSRLATARKRLAVQLAQRGITLSVAALAVMLTEQATASAVPVALLKCTLKASSLFMSGRPIAGMVSASVISMTEAALKTMVLEKLKVVAFALLLLALAGIGVGALVAGTSDRSSRSNDMHLVPSAVKAQPDDSDERAKRFALRVLGQAAAIDRLSRFTYRVRNRHAVVDSMRAIDQITFDQLKNGLTAAALEKDWIGWYETTLAWDEERFLWEMRIVHKGNTAPTTTSWFWTAKDAWERHEGPVKPVVSFVHLADPARLWKHLILFDHSYLRVTPHRFRWGKMVRVNNQTMSSIPPDRANWKHLGVETFAGEQCDVVESVERLQRLWIGRSSGQARGAAVYMLAKVPAHGPTFYETDAVKRIAGRAFASQQEYGRWCLDEASDDQLIELEIAWTKIEPTHFPDDYRLNELVQFDDYREIAPGVSLPFRETQTCVKGSEVPNKHSVERSELRVDGIRTDMKLAERCAKLLPKEGDRIQDQRFRVPVDFDFRAGQTEDEIRKLAEAEYKKRREGEEEIKRRLQPIEAMVGKAAPGLPSDRWIGGAKPDVTGKPYLLHFWATWCGPCKNDLPLLKKLSERGAVILGMHPAGTPPADIEKFIRKEDLRYPTLLGKPGSKNVVSGYPAMCYPYCILVDARGRVVGHGFLTEVLQKFGTEALFPAPKNR